MNLRILQSVLASLLIPAFALSAADAPANTLGSPAFVPSPERPIGFRGDGTGHFPAATPLLNWERKKSGSAYATKGVLWMTHMPTGSIASPIVVGDKIFVCSNFADLLCVDKRSGRILWLKSNGYYEAATDAERADTGFKSSILPLAEDVRKLNERIVEQSNAQVSPNGLTPAQEETFAQLANQKRDKEAKLYDAMHAIDAKRYAGKPCQQHCGTSSGTPCSDGKYVWASFLGGVAGPGSMTVACYDLEGGRQWLQLIDGIGAPEHGNHGSMLLAGTRLVFMGNALLIVFDKDSGTELWRNKGGGGDYTDGIAVPRIIKFNGEDAVFRPFTHANILRLSDGKELAPVTQLYFIWSTPVIQDGIAYWGDRSNNHLLVAVKLPEKTGETAKPLFTVTAPKDSKHTEVVSSPLLHDGLVYSICEGGTLAVVDAQTGKEAYFATPFNVDVKWVFNPGVCESPTLAGANIYLMNDTGTTVVLQPGRSYTPLATNMLEEAPLGGFNFLSSPWFEGKCMYYRSANYLYCVGEK